MNPFLRKIREFSARIWRLKLYVILAAGLVCLFTLAQFSSNVQEERRTAKTKTAELQAKLKKAERLFQKAVQEKGSMENYLKENPREALLMSYAFLFFLMILLYGLWVDGWCVVRWLKKRPALEGLSEEGERARWQIGDVFRVIILFLSFSILFGWISEWAGHLLPRLFNANGRLILHGTLADLAALCLVLYFSNVKYRQDFFKIQIRPGNALSDIGIGISAYLSLLPVVVGLLAALLWIMGLFHYEPPPQKIVEVFVEEASRNPVVFFYSVLLAAVIGPALEEVFFRGFFYTAFRQKYAAVPSALVTSVFFAWLHQSAFAFLPIFLLGLLLAYVYEKRRSIVAPIALHVFHNCLFLGYFFLMKQNFLDKFLH